MRKTTGRSLIVAVITAMLFAAGIGSASAQTAEPQPGLPSDQAVQEYEEVFAHHQIDESQWPGLLAKVASGELLDADNPEAQPTSTRQVVIDGEQFARAEFADGSAALTSIPQDLTTVPSGPTARSVNIQTCGQITTSGGWKNYTNCRVVYDGISFSYSYYVDFQTRSGYNAKVNRAVNATVHRAIGHGVSDVTVGVSRSTQSGTVAAQARMSFTISTAYVSALSRTINLDFFVKGTSYSASTNL
ncbi:hypothetical protein [Cellulomonas hominis]|uniref:hypothetical protein n=1 Tax=Cellulomonas hominis TaxID=156981 RepID=UPI0014444632|nr:hypothetical protein [Cellulomonas hominis]NKY12571.1 hypothetical protein [Cellulomonas hominis]